MALKLRMVPHLEQLGDHPSGIDNVVRNYFRFLPDYDIKLTSLKDEQYDLVGIHAGMTDKGYVGENVPPVLAFVHGLYWSGDYPASAGEFAANRSVIESVRHARETTVPSRWVQEVFQRNMRFSPHIVPHGVDWEAWQHNNPCGNFVLWNKNRAGIDVCNPEPVNKLARMAPDVRFLTTFAADKPTPNINVTGVLPHERMKTVVQMAGVYFSSTKETFGISYLEAMAAGVPILAWAHGGVLDLVEHGVNGYLAQPGNYDDLLNGLRYCLEYRETLGANGREMARQWTWPKACEKVAEVCRLTVRPEPPTVGIVIPAHNKEHTLGDAVLSAQKQTRPVDQIVIVNDGSTDNTLQVALELASQSSRIKVVDQPNAGVANARNRGAAELDTKYLVFLDGDDAIHSQFLEATVPALEADCSIGIAYTGLFRVSAEGKPLELSAWPGPFDPDAQLRPRGADNLRGKNQVPTCCLVRKKAFDRVGGFRARYAPRGAGEEDAELWTRLAAYGWGAKKTTEAGLFLYRLGGTVSSGGVPETFWLAWHPWARDGLFPFAAQARAAKHAHPVFQVDEPAVSVVIPVGPDHAHHLISALDSLEAQLYRKWEAIVVNDSGEPLPAALLTAYPYLRLVETGGRVGSGRARNLGAAAARGQFLLFLDADDWLNPELDVLGQMMATWRQHRAAVYGDYIGISHVKSEADLPRIKGKILAYNAKTHETVVENSAFDYDWRRAQQQPEANPYIWNLISTLVPKSWFDEVGGFDEQMESWEDVDLWWRLARAGRCFVRIRAPLLYYRFSTGTRREAGGGQNGGALIQYLKAKYQRLETKVCNCPSAATGSSSIEAEMALQNGLARAGRQGRVAVAEMNDEDWIDVVYTSMNRGGHRVWGHGSNPKRDYNYHGGGERFLVHRADIKMQPVLFRCPNCASFDPPHWNGGVFKFTDDGKPYCPHCTHLKAAEEELSQETRDLPPPPSAVFTLEPPPVLPLREPSAVPLESVSLSSSPLTQRRLLNVLAENGITTTADVVARGYDELLKIRGIGEETAGRLARAAGLITA